MQLSPQRYLIALLALSLSACAVDEADEADHATSAPAPAAAAEAERAEPPAPAAVTGELETSACEPYDPSYCDEATSCEVFSPYVRCDSGIDMYAHRTPDCRWCIPRDVCAWSPAVCPF